MFKSIILPLANQDIKQAALWYEEKQEGLGRRFIIMIRGTVGFIKQNPKAFKISYDNVRTAVVTGFPFIIHYKVDSKSKTTLVIAVLHTSRNPDIWKTR